MVQVIQMKRRVAGTGSPATLAAGEPAVAMPAAGPAELYVGDGAAVWPLVSSARQVEIAGAQTITGVKTIDAANLKLTGGAASAVLTTDGLGNLTWVVNPPAQIVTGNGLTGNGLVATPVALVPATA